MGGHIDKRGPSILIANSNQIIWQAAAAMDTRKRFEVLLWEWGDANDRDDTTPQQLQERKDVVMAMIEAKFPDPFDMDGEIIDGYMDGVWSPFLFVIVVDA